MFRRSVVDDLDVDLVWGDTTWQDDEESLLLGEHEVGNLLAVLEDSVGCLGQAVDRNLVDSLALGEGILGGIRGKG